MRALLDVNVLIALLDENHVHHDTAQGWLAENVRLGWASCPITQNGCIRILAQPQYPNALGVSDAIGRLREATATSHHAFVPDDQSILDATAIDRKRLLSARQVTDAYLLALAVKHGLRFVTLDRAIPAHAVPGADSYSLVVLS